MNNPPHVRIALLTFTDSERRAVQAMLSARLTPAGKDTWLLNGGEITFLPVDRSGNVSAAAFVARNVRPGDFDFVVSYGCAGALAAAHICSCEDGRDPTCQNAFLVAGGRYHEVGRVEASRGETVTLKGDVIEHPANRFAMPLGGWLAHVLQLNLTAVFVSEKVVHISPTAAPSPLPKRTTYGEALGSLPAFLPRLIDMESAGLAAGAPAFWGLTAAVRVATDGGLDKKEDKDKRLQQSRLNSHTSDLFEVLAYLTGSRFVPLWLLWLAVPPGVLRDAVRMDRLSIDDADGLARVGRQMRDAILRYRSFTEDPQEELGDQRLAETARTQLAGEGYPSRLLIQLPVTPPTPWDLLVLAAEDPVPPAFWLESAEEPDLVETQRSAAIELASRLRELLVQLLTELR
jgi:hypothetical protein